MLHDPARHERMPALAWSEQRARGALERIVRDTEAHFTPGRYWPLHPRDVDPGEDPNQAATGLYYGACGVMWALNYLQGVGAVALSRDCLGDEADVASLVGHNHATLQAWGSRDFASYLAGDTPIHLLAFGRAPTADCAEQLAALIAGNLNHPSRELYWGAPGTMLAALFLHQRTGEARWADLFRETAATLWSQLQWSPEHACHYWTQDLYGRQTTYLDAVHGFVGNALPLIHGRHLLDQKAWVAWHDCIVNTIERTATWDGAMANWRDLLDMPAGYAWKRLMQFCHGAPGFVVCLAHFPGTALDALLVAAGEAIWAAGPLAKGSNLCHGTSGNGYAFLKLHRRTGDPRWLDRARAFAMHAIVQSEAEAQQYGQRRYSLWTGDLGVAIYLCDCLRGGADFPTLDVFYPPT